MNLTGKTYVPFDSFVHPRAVLIGDIKIGHECLIAPNVSIRADFCPVTISVRSNVQDNAVIDVYPDARVIIEEDVTIAHGVIIHDAHIKSRCVIGIGAIILFDAVCGEDVIVNLAAELILFPGREYLRSCPKIDN
jgi:phenylacetic acid degradation protein